VKEGVFMEAINATVEVVDEKVFIRIDMEAGVVKIPLSEDKPVDVKSAFNKIITRIKLGQFEIKLDKLGEDLFSLVAAEYLTQLNREIKEVHGDMLAKGLI
jgi:hypothetical protein